jgi:hypothetical protein
MKPHINTVLYHQVHFSMSNKLSVYPRRVLFLSNPVRRLVAGLFVLLTTGGASYGQQADWKPDRNVEVIVGAAAAGANDRIVRSIQNALQANRLIPVSMSVVNKPGGGQTRRSQWRT